MSGNSEIINNIKSFMISDDKGDSVESIHAFWMRLCENAPTPDDRMAYSVVYTILTGRYTPTEETLGKFARCLGTNPEYLRYGRGPRHVDASERQEAC